MKFGDKTALFLATGACIGYTPFMPGTLGSLWGLPICWLLSKTALPIAMIFTLFFIILAVWIAHRAEKKIGQKDPSCIVIDEVAGQITTLVGLPVNWISLAAGFVVFRGLDILKPWPIRLVEKNISGGAGVVLDDVAAGILGNILLQLVFHLTDII